jgi:catechol-2,3-dioxygenase
MFKIKSLGHVVLNVSNLEKSEKFYSGLLGLPVCARFDEQGMKMTFFTLGDHHDLAIAEVSGEPNTSGEDTVGLGHVAFCIGSTIDELKEAKERLEGAGVEADPVDHEVTKSLYFDAPDGNNIELYVDASDVWRQEPQRVAQIGPLEL